MDGVLDTFRWVALDAQRHDPPPPTPRARAFSLLPPQRMAKCGNVEKEKKFRNKVTRVTLCARVSDAVDSLDGPAGQAPPLPIAQGDKLPVWWTAPHMDNALLRGTKQHGFGCYRDMFADAALFPRGSVPPSTDPDDKELQATLFRRIRALTERLPAPAKRPTGAGGTKRAHEGGESRQDMPHLKKKILLGKQAI